MIVGDFITLALNSSQIPHSRHRLASTTSGINMARRDGERAMFLCSSWSLNAKPPFMDSGRQLANTICYALNLHGSSTGGKAAIEEQRIPGKSSPTSSGSLCLDPYSYICTDVCTSDPSLGALHYPPADMSQFWTNLIVELGPRRWRRTRFSSRNSPSLNVGTRAVATLAHWLSPDFAWQLSGRLSHEPRQPEWPRLQPYSGG